MTRFAFVHGVLFSLYFISYQCEGAITSPPDGTEYVFLPGQMAKIKWEFNDAISSLRLRIWSFISSDGPLKDEGLASIFRDGSTEIETKLFEVDIERPATLVLKNVNQSYTGIYRFSLATSTSFASAVGVSIAKKPTTMVNCPSRNEVNEGGDFTCECSSKSGIPENNATWFKNGVQIGETRKENVTLNLTDVNATDGGTYKCVAQSYFGEAFKDEKSIELIVRLNSQPNNTSIRFIPNPATLGNQVEIRCDSEGVPEPSFIIMRNGENVSTEKTYTISPVKQSDEGPYVCIAVNILGNDSVTDNLTIIEQGQTTSPSTTAMSTSKTASTTMKDKAFCNDISCGTEWYIVVVSLVSGIIIGIIFSYFVQCSHRRWFRKRKPEQNPEPRATEVDTTYQELDLTKMNAEDNYQSLRVNAASNIAGNDDDDSTYTELNKTRDVENNYQSLT